MILVDSSVWIDFFNGQTTAETDFLDVTIETGSVIVGDIVLMEVLQGLRSDREFERALRLLSLLPQLTIIDQASAVAAARNFRRLRALGVTVRKSIDTLIATRCIVDGLPLLYSDRDFEPFRTHLGLLSALQKA